MISETSGRSCRFASRVRLFDQSSSLSLSLSQLDMKASKLTMREEGNEIGGRTREMGENPAQENAPKGLTSGSYQRSASLLFPRAIELGYSPNTLRTKEKAKNASRSKEKTHLAQKKEKRREDSSLIPPPSLSLSSVFFPYLLQEQVDG